MKMGFKLQQLIRNYKNQSNRIRNRSTMSQILYKDHTVQIGESYLRIFKYYFPLATSKTIMFTDIEKVTLEDGIGAGQNWGLCARYLNNWFPLDRTRKNKLKFIAVHVKGKKIIPSFTPEDPLKVLQLIYENFTEEGKRVVQYRLSQCGKQTQMAQQEIIERMKEEQAQKQSEKTEKTVEKAKGSPQKRKIQDKSADSPSKRKIIKAQTIEVIQ